MKNNDKIQEESTAIARDRYGSAAVWEPSRDNYRMIVMLLMFVMTMAHCYGETYIECPCCDSTLIIDISELEESGFQCKGFFDEDTDWTCNNPYCDNEDKRSRDEPCSDCDKYKNEKYNRNKADRHKSKDGKKKR